ncbi:6217_t:CDS:2 [Acaulospora colombiana]|uniref:6217_t:CDS:1 n=1 Tax=Acaulospora colombiana TaxID=27376 RepID=A0ACA9NJJ2_9GLOM|nr:6217_t:CDS:2 [Acaulospora colombiana]
MSLDHDHIQLREIMSESATPLIDNEELHAAASISDVEPQQPLRRRLAISFFLFGLINNGGAGLVGAALWWLLRRIGVKTGILICSVGQNFSPSCPAVDICFAGTFRTSISREDYVAVPTDEVDDGNPMSPALDPETSRPVKASLSLRDKWLIVKPQLGKYMVPLFSVYLVSEIFFEQLYAGNLTDTSLSCLRRSEIIYLFLLNQDT